jgi:FixJ family two-component response regulator
MLSVTEENKKTTIQKFKIAILEDNMFYNRLLKKQLDDYFENLGVLTNCVFSIKSFTNTTDFINNFSESTDVALLDFYLEDGETALKVMEQIKEKSKDCNVIIISGIKIIHSYYKTFWLGAVDFVNKDRTAPLRTCRLIESIFAEKLGVKS